MVEVEAQATHKVTKKRPPKLPFLKTHRDDLILAAVELKKTKLIKWDRH